MPRPVTARFRALLSAAAIAAALPLAACDRTGGDSAMSAYGLPDLPATLPLAVGAPTQPIYAPAGYDLAAAPLLPAARVADPDEHYAYADDAWGFEDSLGYAPPDYGFYYDEVEPWAWQGYDDSLMFVEPLEVGYRTYFYRPGDDYPYFIRDPDCGYGYDNGRLVVIYNSYGGVIPYADYGPRYAYASRYYLRGRDLYWASRQRHPVIAANWIDRRPVLTAAYRDWAQDRWQQPAWRAYHERVAAPRERHWQPERARRQADAVRFATWSNQGFRTASPPRAIPAQWTRAKWARDERRFAPPAAGFLGDPAKHRQAVEKERARVASLVADRGEQARGVAELRRAALVERQADRRAERGGIVEPRVSPPISVRDARIERRAEGMVVSERRQEARHQADLQREAAAGARVVAQERQETQAAERRRVAQVEARQMNEQARARQAEARQREQATTAARQQSQVRRAAAETRQREQAEVQQAAQRRRVVMREQAQTRAADRTQRLEQAQQRREQPEQARATRVERPQRESRPARVAEAEQGDQDRRGRRQR